MKKAVEVFVIFLSVVCLSCSSIHKKNEPVLRYEYGFETFHDIFWASSNHSFGNNLTEFSEKNAGIKTNKLILKLTADAKGEKPCTGAEIRTRRTFKHGKFIARLKAAKGNGVISSVVLYDTWGKKSQKIGIEFSGKNITEVTFNNLTNKSSDGKSFNLGFDASADFHDYSICWKRNEIIWEVDGKELYRVQENIPNHQLILMANIRASKNNDRTDEIDLTQLPQQVEIDYIKIYSFK